MQSLTQRILKATADTKYNKKCNLCVCSIEITFIDLTNLKIVISMFDDVLKKKLLSIPKI